MARILNVNMADEVLRKRLLRSFQSGNIAFLLGSGASLPAIPAAGAIEAEIATILANGEEQLAYSKMSEFLTSIQEPTNRMIGGEHTAEITTTLKGYEDFLRVVEEVLLARRTNLLPRQVTIFSTNYDLFVERASAACPTALLNDGFTRAPGLGFQMDFSSRNFFRATYSTGNLYEYKVEIPSVNLIKLHGSLTWAKSASGIRLHGGATDLPTEDYQSQRKFVEAAAVVLPQAAKFRETLMDRTYYDLLRIYANTLDRENTILIVFGFSFGDEHIRDITIRALKNPTLRLMIFAYNSADRDKFGTLFEQYSNVEVVSSGENLNFEEFNAALRHVLHEPEKV